MLGVTLSGAENTGSRGAEPYISGSSQLHLLSLLFSDVIYFSVEYEVLGLVTYILWEGYWLL